MQLSRHFTLAEMSHSNTAQAEGIDNQPGPAETACLQALCTSLLDPLREAVGLPIKVNSGYRGPALNKRIGGATKSQHLIGEAADIQAPGMSVLALFQKAIAMRLPYDQIIYEANGAAKWVHLSFHVGANRGQILVADFGPDGRIRGYPSRTADEALAMTEPRTRSRSHDGEPVAPLYLELPDEPVPMPSPPANPNPPQRAPTEPATERKAPVRRARGSVSATPAAGATAAKPRSTTRKARKSATTASAAPKAAAPSKPAASPKATARKRPVKMA